MVRVLRCVTARSRIFSHRTTAHGPHKTASSAGPTVQSPAAGAPLVQGVEASLRRYAQPATAAALQVLTAALGMRAELTGALQMAASMAAR